MDKELHYSHPVIRRIYLYIFIVTFLLFFVFIVLYFSKVQPNPEEQTTGQQVQAPALQIVKKGNLVLSVKNNDLNQVQLGQTFNLSVVASSEDSSIVGFDVLLSYNQDAFTIGKATTPLQSFQLFSSERGNHQSFTGALSVNGKAAAFTNTQILTVPFTPKQKGKYTFTVLPSSGKETTKLVEVETTKLFAPEVTPLQVTVN